MGLLHYLGITDIGELIPGGFRKLEVVDAIGDETSDA
jgi:hypothetical protein